MQYGRESRVRSARKWSMQAAAALFHSLLCRLGMMWPGVEPQKGQYNYTYLKVARDITNK